MPVRRSPALFCLPLVALLAAACGGPAAREPGFGRLDARAATAADDDRGPPAHFRLHAFDVGTGLSLLLEGEDFALLYDGGSNDDREVGPSNRLLAYLDATLGHSGGPGCRFAGAAPADAATYDERPIAHLVLSHPHRDHLNLLPDVLRCYRVANVWDSGAPGDTAGYGAFLAAIAGEAGAVYHTARPPPADHTARAHGGAYAIAAWRRFGEGETIALGRRARAEVLHVAYDVEDLNDASIVLRVELGRATVIFAGDATAGPRASPSEEPAAGSVEAQLLARHRAELRADVLQVGHHGSRTSSRTRFLDAIRPKWAIVSSGPMRYGPVTLPDADVVSELSRRGARVLRTDLDDEGCGARADKVGPPADGRPGGCDAFTLRIDSSGDVALAP